MRFLPILSFYALIYFIVAILTPPSPPAAAKFLTSLTPGVRSPRSIGPQNFSPKTTKIHINGGGKGC